MNTPGSESVEITGQASATKSMNTDKTEPETEKTPTITDKSGSKSMNMTETDTTQTKETECITSKTETTEQEAADGLIMLEQLAEMDQPDLDENTDLPLIPLTGHIGLDEGANDNTVPLLTAPEVSIPTLNIDKDNSDDTIIYDSETYQLKPQFEEPTPRKGILTITEVVIRSKPTDNTDPVYTVDTSRNIPLQYCTGNVDMVDTINI